MVSAASKRLLDDVKAEEDISLRLQKHLSADGRIPRAEKLQLVTAILDHITSTGTSNQHETFLQALGFLRSLVPHMKTKSKSLVDTVATVERYSVNYGLRLIAKSGVQSHTLFLKESLLVIFQARMKNTQQPKPRPRITRSTPLLFEKENIDPQKCTESEPESLILQFLAASNNKISVRDMLPQADSPVVASTITGAITVLFTANDERFTLSQLLLLTQRLLMPWIEFLLSFGEVSLDSTACAYASRINRFLLVQCRITKSNPFDVFKVRSFAIKIGEIKLNRYAKELLQSANFLLRNKTLSEKEHLLASDLVFEVYEDAERFMSTFDVEDPKWFFEDVSAWIDSVFLLWSKKKLFPRIPKLIQRRKSIHCKNRHHSFLALCFSLQEALYNVGAFCKEKALVFEGDVQVFSKTMWAKVEEILRSSGFQNQSDYLQPPDLSSGEDEAENVGLESLRLLRVLEPVRQIIASVSKEQVNLPHGAECVLRIFLKTILRGLRTSFHQTKSSKVPELFEEVESRLQKMVGGAVQAARSLLHHYWDSHEPQCFGSVYKLTYCIINQHQRFCEDSARRWRSWVFVPLLSKFEIQLRTGNKGNCNESAEALERVAVVAEVCLSNPSELLQNTFIPTEFNSLFEIAREAYACLRQWSKMVFVSLNWLSIHSTAIRVREPGQVAKLAAQTFVQDAVNSILKESTLPTLESIALDYDFVLGILHEYVWWTYSNFDECKSVDRMDQLRYGIQLARLFYLKQCNSYDGSCAVDQLQFLWLLYACEDHDSRKDFTTAISGKIRCKGHMRTGVLSTQQRKSPCMSPHFSFAEELLSCWNALDADKFSDVGKSLSKLVKLTSSNPNMMDCLELRIISIEILEWIGVQLGLQSYGAFARQVGELLQLCRPRKNPSGSVIFETCLEDPLFEGSTLLKEDTKTIKWSYSTRYFGFQDGSLNLIVETEQTMQCLKSILLQLEIGRNRKKLKTREPTSCVIAGAVIDIGFHVRNEMGKRSFSKVLLLTHNLIRLAIILVSMENMIDSRYYIEKSLYIAKQCFPRRSFLLRLISIMHETICVPEASKRMEVEGNLASMAVETYGSIDDGTDTGILGSLITELCWSMLDTTVSRFHERASSEHNLPLIETLEQCEEVFNGTSKSEALNSISKVELRLLMGMAYTVLGNHEKATPFIEPSTVHDFHSLSSLGMFATFCVVWCNLELAKNMERTSENSKERFITNKKPSARITRSRSRKAETVCSEGADFKKERVEKAKTSLKMVEREDVWNLGLPWIQRRLMSIRGFLVESPQSEPCRAVLSIGTTFNLRRKYAAQVQSKVSPEQTSTSIPAFQQTSWTSIMSGRKQLQQIKDWLHEKKSVLVGLTIDEQRQNMLIWRMSRTGTTSKSLLLAETGPVSYDGVLSRMEDVLSLVKNGAAKPGQKFSKQEKIQWWEERSCLDEEMRSILMDIETHWLGSEGAALLAPTILSETTSGTTSRRSKQRSRATRKETKVDESPELLVKALEKLSLHDGTASSSGRQGSFAGHLILIVDTALERLPWESLPVLRNLNVTASRVPSLSYLYDCIRDSSEDIDVEKLFYIINPAGDLQRTENHFQKVLTQYPTWSGFSGIAEVDAVAAKYDGEEIFLYCGHGSGEQYFPPVRLCRKRKAPVALLMGCSSLRPSNLGIGDQESNGTAINFLMHGSKAVVGNLWDVTDGEIDRLTTSILREWLGFDETGSRGERRLTLAEALAESRPKCMLPYLVGAACVVIGIPHLYASSS
ncbi:unnamed protein product [Agarophyton chilense]